MSTPDDGTLVFQGTNNQFGTVGTDALGDLFVYALRNPENFYSSVLCYTSDTVRAVLTFAGPMALQEPPWR